MHVAAGEHFGEDVAHLFAHAQQADGAALGIFIVAHKPKPFKRSTPRG